MDKFKKKNYITLLSIISAISVVILHTNGCFWIFSNKRYWFTANIIECLFYFAVPIFFMITGITLMNYRDKYDTKTYFKKRIIKTVIPFIIWSLIALLYRIYYIKDISTASLNFQYIFNGILGTKFITIYWFFIPLFIVYLVIPILSAIDKKKRNSIFMYIVILNFILISCFPLINNIFKLGLALPITSIIGTEYTSYVLIGYLLDNNELKKNHKIIIYILGIIGLLVHIILTYIVSKESGMVLRTYKGYNNVPCILYSTAVFILLKDIFSKIKGEKALKYASIFSKYTFAIYLMHFYIMQIIQKEFDLSIYSIIYRLGMPLIIIPICILITWLLRKIPIIKHIVP
ncbi:MAG: acyltransferase [Bacilli bacterium]|nr:acyltransferase [Bacilli bacterium]